MIEIVAVIALPALLCRRASRVEELRLIFWIRRGWGADERPEWWTSGRRGGSFEDAAPRACACVEDCGAFGTVISNAKWFPKPWRVRGFPGVVDLAVPADLVGGAAAAATARAAGPPAIDAAAAPAKKTGNRRQRRARLQSGPGAAA